jgi:hypothetical protein
MAGAVAMRSIVGMSLGWALGACATLAATSAAAAALTVFESQMPDGSTVVGDRPAAGARSVLTRKYEYTPVPSDVAKSERDYWRQQAEGFERRRMEAERAEGLGRVPRSIPAGAPADADLYYPMWAGYGHAAWPLVLRDRFPRHYRTSPGAARGRHGGFIGSGFSTAR